MRYAILLLAVAGVATVYAADPTTPMFWSASQLSQRQSKAKGEVDPHLHRGVERLIDSASVIYRDGPSEAEAHTDRADFIAVREGRGTMVIGGRMIGRKETSPTEARGTSVEGGETYRLAAGDVLYIPVNVPHQFFVQPGEHLVVTIVKMVPRP